MFSYSSASYSQFELEMNDAMRDVALEIRSVDLLDLASFIHAQNFANVGDIINSASELYFKPGALMFSYSADVKLDWFGCPMIALDLELHESGVDIYFELKIDAFSSYIQIKHAAVNGKPLRIPEDAEIFRLAIDKAKTVRNFGRFKTLEWSQVFKSSAHFSKLTSSR